MVLLKVFRPAGRGRDGCYFLNDQKVTKESLGAASGEHLACGGAHSHCPQTPGYGSVPLWALYNPRRAKSRSVFVLLSAHWGLLLLKFVRHCALTHTAWCVPTCLVRRWSGTRQLPSRHSFTALGGILSAQNAANFSLGRPQWAGARRRQGLVFGAAGRKCLYSRRASPVNGVRGKATMSARCA